MKQLSVLQWLRMKKNYLFLLIALGVGSLFSVGTVLGDYMRFYDVEGTIFRIKDCASPNPLMTPCFWGAIAFVVAFFWARRLYYRLERYDMYIYHTSLSVFLVGGSIFAWTNFMRGYLAFINHGSKPIIGCSGQLVTNPFETPCFWGSVLFSISLVIAIGLWIGLRRSHATAIIE